MSERKAKLDALGKIVTYKEDTEESELEESFDTCASDSESSDENSDENTFVEQIIEIVDDTMNAAEQAAADAMLAANGARRTRHSLIRELAIVPEFTRNNFVKFIACAKQLNKTSNAEYTLKDILATI